MKHKLKGTKLRGRQIYSAGGLYVSARLAERFLPREPLLACPHTIEESLATKFYPGVFGIFRYSPSSLAQFWKGARIPAFCIASGDWSAHTLRLEDHPTWEYVRHALAYAHSGSEDCIKAVWELGQKAWDNHGIPLGRFRRISEFEKVPTNEWSLDHARQYVERVVGLAGIIRTSGDVPTYGELAEASGRTDGEIGIAVGRDGKIMHFRKGHHRIMIAHQLKMNSMLVSVEIVHSEWLAATCNMHVRELAEAIRHGSVETATSLKSTIAAHVERQNLIPHDIDIRADRR